jgi:hypothetical protein
MTMVKREMKTMKAKKNSMMMRIAQNWKIS